MRTVLSRDNPAGYSRAGYAWEKVPVGAEAHLDFGCHDGGFLGQLARKGNRRLVGVDVCREAIERGRGRYPQLELLHVGDAGRLPFADASFDSISILDVIEHVADQTRVLDELHRLLKPDGLLIVTVPGQYAFSFLDLGNLKFRFPRLHRWAYCCVRSRAEYEARYAANADGLIGDVEVGKAWHEHFTRESLRTLLGRSGFEVAEWDGSGFFGRPIHVVALPAKWVRPVARLLAPIHRADARLFSSMNLYCTARKRGVCRT